MGRSRSTRSGTRRLALLVLLGVGLGGMTPMEPIAATATPTYADAVRLFKSRDYAVGAVILQTLAEAGDARAQFFLGSGQLTGAPGIAVDRPQGYAWLQIAASRYVGSYGQSAADEAAKALLEVGPKLSGSELLRAEQLAGAFLAVQKQRYDDRLHAAYEVLIGRNPGSDRTRRTGCGVDPRLNGCPPRGLGKATLPSCTANLVQPDVPPSNVGPLAWSNRTEYPREAVRRLTEGGFVALAHVDHTGLVCYVVPVLGSGNDAMDEAALENLRTRRFQPALKDGQPVEATYTQQMNFAISEFQLDAK